MTFNRIEQITQKQTIFATGSNIRIILAFTQFVIFFIGIFNSTNKGRNTTYPISPILKSRNKIKNNFSNGINYIFYFFIPSISLITSSTFATILFCSARGGRAKGNATIFSLDILGCAPPSPKSINACLLAIKYHIKYLL